MSEELESSGGSESAKELRTTGHPSKPVSASDEERRPSKRQLIVGLPILAIGVGLLTVIGIKSNWSFGDSVGVASMVVSILGFGIAIAEIQRARSVAMATRAAVDGTLRRVETARLQVTITEMQGLATTIEDACDQGEMKSFRDSSRRWRNLAGSAMALIGQRTGDDDGVIILLENARRLGREANQAAHEEEGVTLRDVAKDFLVAIVEVTDALTLLAEDLLSTIEPLNER